ncbi:MAG: LicD family protein [Butyrivibrio sp.]|nr:LicD family protein [Butyrivibrio sp.]
MLTIPPEFLKEEERDGFLIPETMKRAWAVQLTLLDQVLEIAKRHGLTVFMDYGSVLGAVRHHGYIPWDDDLDICLKRKDYMRLLDALEKELPPETKVYSFYNTEDYRQPKAFVANRAVIDIGIDSKEAELTHKSFDCPYSTGIDICPLDYVPADEDQFNLIRQIYIAIYDLAMRMDTFIAQGEFEDYLSQIEEILNFSVKRDENIRTSLWKLADNVAMMTTREEAGFLMWYPATCVRSEDMRLPLSIYKRPLWVDFEFTKVPIPEGSEDFLKRLYGENYMTPRFALAAHEYPFYKIQDKKILHNSMLGQLCDVF